MITPIYNEDGSVKDWNDNGQQASDILADFDIQLTIKRLPIKLGQILELTLQGYNIKEIADQLHITRQTASTRLKKAGKELKSHL